MFDSLTTEVTTAAVESLLSKHKEVEVVCKVFLAIDCLCSRVCRLPYLQNIY